jgi:hypothetical protein
MRRTQRNAEDGTPNEVLTPRAGISFRVQSSASSGVKAVPLIHAKRSTHADPLNRSNPRSTLLT